MQRAPIWGSLHIRKEVYMNITLYNCSAEPNRLDKTSYLTPVASSATAAANTELGVEHLVVTFESSSDLSNVNYLYIAELGRYYNVKEITAPVNNLWLFSCDVDVLMTYKSQIVNLYGIVNRNSNNYDMYLADNQIPVGARKTFSIMKFPTNAFGSGADSRIFIQVLGGE